MSSKYGRILNQSQIDQLIAGAVNGRTQTQEQLQLVLDWAHRVKIESATLDLVIKGKLDAFCREKDNEITFQHPIAPQVKVVNEHFSSGDDV